MMPVRPKWSRGTTVREPDTSWGSEKNAFNSRKGDEREEHVDHAACQRVHVQQKVAGEEFRGGKLADRELALRDQHAGGRDHSRMPDHLP